MFLLNGDRRQAAISLRHWQTDNLTVLAYKKNRKTDQQENGQMHDAAY